MPRRGTKRKRDEQHTDEYIDEHGSKRYKQLCSGLISMDYGHKHIETHDQTLENIEY